MSKRKEADGGSEKGAKKAKKEKKEACPISQEDFEKHAKNIKVLVDGTEHEAVPKVFKSGSFGWTVAVKPKITVDGKELQATGNVNITVKGSKPKKAAKKKAKDDDEDGDE